MLSLFSGIGGIDLAAQWAGIETVAFCEKDKWLRSKLAKQWRNVDYYDFYDDIKELKGREIIARHGTIDIISGGFPCQPFSQAGKRRGKEDDRHLWPEMLRVIKEIWPTWIVGENVPGIVGMELDNVLTDLENNYYETQTFNIPACAVGARHKRSRIFIVAHSSIERKRKLPIQSREPRQTNIDADRKSQNLCDANKFYDDNSGCGAGEISQFEASEILEHNDADANSKRLQRHGGLCECANQWPAWKGRRPFQDIWQSEPDVGRLAHGVPERVAKLKALGNAVVPQQIYPIFKAIMEVSQ